MGTLALLTGVAGKGQGCPREKMNTSPFPCPGGVQLETGPDEDHSPQGTGREMTLPLFFLRNSRVFCTHLSCACWTQTGGQKPRGKLFNASVQKHELGTGPSSPQVGAQGCGDETDPLWDPRSRRAVACSPGDLTLGWGWRPPASPTPTDSLQSASPKGRPPPPAPRPGSSSSPRARSGCPKGRGL